VEEVPDLEIGEAAAAGLPRSADGGSGRGPLFFESRIIRHKRI
jgi:hypothetical protein